MSERCLLYYITDRTAFAADEPTRRRRLLEKISEAARAQIDYIQLREKDLPTHDLESLASEALRAIRETRGQSTAFLINSRTDVAISTGADGVHLRSDDISPAEVQQVWNKCGAPTRASQQAPLIAVSCHSPREVEQAAQLGATFAVFAPVFEKKDLPGTRPTGLIQLREACKASLPVLALGGVTLQNAQSCVQAGAAGIAGIRLFQENEVSAVAESLRRLPL